MSDRSANAFLCHKLRESSLFKTYAQAFQLVSRAELRLLAERPETGVFVEVSVGKDQVLYLVPLPKGDDWNECSLRLLQIFAIQLSEEANRAVMESDGADPDAVARAKAFLRENAHEKTQLDDVAEAVGIGSFQLCRQFKSHTGITMTEFTSRIRVERAKLLLEDPKYQISQVADEVGFTSLSQFNRNFLKHTGQSPSEYRTGLRELEHCELADV